MKKSAFIFSLLLLCACARTPAPLVDSVMVVEDGRINYFMTGEQAPFKAMFIADTHFTLEDERGLPWQDNTQRMGRDAAKPENYGQMLGRDEHILKALDQAKAEGVELVILAGDIVNYPSLASVEWIDSTMQASGLPWVFIAGNHDWHYEGEDAPSHDLRAKWTATNLKPLYQGEDPMGYSRQVNGINFVLIDNSTYQITPAQLDFFRQETQKGLPVMLVMHIPLYFAGRDINYGVGHPEWGAETDPYYQIERRERWPAEGHTQTTYDFYNAVWDSPQVIGILAGHIHERAAGWHKGKPQFVSGAGFKDGWYLLNFE